MCEHIIYVVFTNAYQHIYARVHTHTRIHTHTRTHLRTHTHAHMIENPTRKKETVA